MFPEICPSTHNIVHNDCKSTVGFGKHNILTQK